MCESVNVEYKLLLDKAKEAREKAYAPYSKYRVGAALLTVEGDIFMGCNVENVSYGLSMCAERTALFTAIAAGKRDFSAIAIVASSPEVSPCGACRQVLCELAPQAEIITFSRAGDIKIKKVAELLPEAFNLVVSSQ